ncbi:MAG: hypothetical protein WEG40_12465 [Candidatus Rokuibacteriota bacterium]
MNWRLIRRIGLGAVALLVVIGGAWVLALPLPPTVIDPPPIAQEEAGIRILPDEVATSWPAAHLLPAIGDRQPARALDEALQAITARYGMRTADFVAMQLEYPKPGGV